MKGMDAINWNDESIPVANEEQYRDEIMSLVMEITSMEKLIRIYSCIVGLHHDGK